EDGIRDRNVTGVQTCALPILTITVPIALRTMCVRTARAGLPPIPRIATMKSRERRAMESPRTMRAAFAWLNPAMISTRIGTVGRSEERRVGEDASGRERSETR